MPRGNGTFLWAVRWNPTVGLFQVITLSGQQAERWFDQGAAFVKANQAYTVCGKLNARREKNGQLSLGEGVL